MAEVREEGGGKGCREKENKLGPTEANRDEPSRNSYKKVGWKEACAGNTENGRVGTFDIG